MYKIKATTTKKNGITWIFTVLISGERMALVNLVKENIIGTSISPFSNKANRCNNKMSGSLWLHLPFQWVFFFFVLLGSISLCLPLRWLFYLFGQNGLSKKWETKKEDTQTTEFKNNFIQWNFACLKIESSKMWVCVNFHGKIWMCWNCCKAIAYLIKTNCKHHLDTCKHSIIMVIDTKTKELLG